LEEEDKYMDGKSKIYYTKALSLSNPQSNFQGFHPEKKILPVGHVERTGCKPLECKIILERDAAIRVRDGITLYADIFRPDTEEKVPAILCSSIFGKHGSYNTIDNMSQLYDPQQRRERLGVTLDMVSGLEMFEAADPGFWCLHNYAVVNLDIRGVGMSEGDAHYFGQQDAEDNYDVIEWLAVQPWCNGAVTMSGNSWLGITQWFTAALKPPHLKCIAPWEGHGNMYEDEYMRGGIPHYSVVRFNMCYGNNNMEDLPTMMTKYPLINDYWKGTMADFEKVTVPAYVVASYTSAVHTHGTFEGWSRISSEEKWLRVHNTQEWYDMYQYEHELDLLKFFDYYLKDIDNDWPKTSKVRLCILDPGHEDIMDRPEEDFPIPRQKYIKMYLDAGDQTIKNVLPQKTSEITYVSDDAKDYGYFDWVFEEDTEITGYIKLHLWVSSLEHDNMDVYARIQKLDVHKRPVWNDAYTMFYGGPNAMLRVSQRELDLNRSTESQPYHTHSKIEPLKRGEKVAVEMGFWPTGMIFHAGETLRLILAGFDYGGKQKPECTCLDSDNAGYHHIHTGGMYDSFLYVPVIPPADKV